MNIQVLVGRNIRKIRVKRGLSQENLAVDAQIGTTHLNEIERGIANPTIVMLEQIANALGTKARDFFVDLPANEKPPKPLPSGRRAKK